MTPLVALVLLAAVVRDPFAGGATFQIDGDPALYPVHGPWYYAAPTAPEWTASSGADETFEEDSIPADAPVPDPASWNPIYRINIGLQIENMEHVWWPDATGYLGQQHEALVHLKSAFQTLSAVLERDVGVELKIVHVQFSEYAADYDWNAWRDRWLSLPLSEPIQSVMRLGGPAGGGTRAADCNSLVIGRSDYPFLDFWRPQNTYNRNFYLSIVLHELGHQALGLHHTQCYDPPIELCHDETSGCWNGPTDCSSIGNCKDASFQGFCAACGCDGTRSPLTLGPRMGTLARYARQAALDYAACAPLAVYATGRTNPMTYWWWRVDTDLDRFPNVMDNCPQIENNTQEDADLDGVGDACDSGCQIQPTAPPAWYLLMVLMALMLVRRKVRR